MFSSHIDLDPQVGFVGIVFSRVGWVAPGCQRKIVPEPFGNRFAVVNPDSEEIGVMGWTAKARLARKLVGIVG
jgi:hypothetical protein